MVKFFKASLQKYNNLSLPVKAAIWFVICNIVQRGIQFISMPIFTRIISTEQYGIYMTFMSWMNLLTIVSSLGIYGNTFNKAMVKYANQDRDRYISSVQFLTTLTTIIVSIVFVVFNYFGIVNIEMNTVGIVMSVVYLLSFPTIQYWYQIKRFEYGYKALVAVTLTISFLSVLLGVVAVVLSSASGSALVISTVMVQAVFAVVFYVQIASKGKVFFKRDYWLWSLKLSLPLIPGALSEILLGHADRLMISSMYGFSKAAIYSTVYQISMVMAIVRTGINGAYVPWLYRSLGNKNNKSISGVIKFIIILFSLMTILSMLIGPELLMIVAPSDYYEALIDIPAIMLGCFFVSYYYMIEQLEVYSEKVIFSSVVSVLGAVLNIVLNYFMIPQFGYLIAGYTTMICYGIMALLHTLYFCHIKKNVKEIAGIVDLKFFSLIIMLVIVLSALCFVLYNVPSIVRYILITALLIIALIKRKTIKSYFEIMKDKEKNNERTVL